MKQYKINQIEYKRILGRNVKGVGNGKKPLALFWAGSALEICVKAKEVWAQLSCDYDVYESFVTVFVNGFQTMRFIPSKTNSSWYCVARNLNPTKNNVITIMKDTQPMPGDFNHSLYIHKIRLNKDGVFCPLENRNLSIEFVGDSITTGEGMVGNPDEMDWISQWMSVSNNYAVQTAKMLNADFSIVSQCGWGICWGWDGNRNNNIPKYYNQVCGVIGGKKQEKIGALDLYNFEDSKKDYVIINLGTNDNSAFKQSPWKDLETGKLYELSLTKAGKLKKEDKKYIVDSTLNFLSNVRKNNPCSKIIWALGMMKVPLIFECVSEAIDIYKTKNKDKNVFLLELDSMDNVEKFDCQKGARMHPGPVVHKLAAQKISDFIRTQIQYERIINVFNKIKMGKDVNIAVFGGSITTGYSSFPMQHKSWASLLEKWFKNLAKKYNSKINFLNMGVSGTDSAFGIIRVSDHIIKNNVDLMILEFAMNDQWLSENTRKNTYEGLIRKLYINPEFAIFALFVNEKLYPYSNNQYEQKKICEYYRIPSLSWKDCVFEENINADFSQYFDKDENIHPNNNGHKKIAELLIQKFEKILNMAESTNLGKKDKEFCLPKPMTQNQFENCVFYHNGNIKPIINNNWDCDSPVHPEWEKHGGAQKGWQCSVQNSEIAFRVQGVSVGVIFAESDQFDDAVCWVTKNDGTETPQIEIKCFSEMRKGYLGWAYKEIYNSKTKEEVVLHIRTKFCNKNNAIANISGIIVGSMNLDQ